MTIASVSRVLSQGGSGRPRLQMPPGCGESSEWRVTSCRRYQAMIMHSYLTLLNIGGEAENSLTYL